MRFSTIILYIVIEKNLYLFTENTTVNNTLIKFALFLSCSHFVSALQSEAYLDWTER